MPLIGSEREELREQIIAMTKDGRVQDWVERIADIAREVGLDLSSISWQGAPVEVAIEVIRFAEKHTKLDTLRNVLSKRQGVAK